MSQDFKNMTEAFEWFFENIYPSLSTEQKRKLKDVKYDFFKRDNKKVSEKRMKRILDEHGCRVEVVFRVHV